MITLAELKTYLKIDSNDSSKDSQLNLAITNAKGFLEWYLMYSLELNATKIAFFNWKYNSFELKETRINSVSKIESWEDEFEDLTEYTWKKRVDLERWLIKTQETLWDFVQITYSFWYDETTCPGDLKMALLEIWAMHFKNMWRVWMWDLKSESVDWDNVVFKDVTWKLSDNSYIILNKYKQYDFSS